MNELLIFLSSMALTMFLGFQSKNVNQSKYVAAACTSVAISFCNLITVKAIITDEPLSIGLMMIGSAIGIVLSIYLHDNYLKKKP